jgi:hypothetical protein
MCLISDDIENVSDTNILISPNSDNTKQLVVYSNYINNLSQSNAMVLPVPNSSTLEFIDLTNYKNLFDDCKKCFYEPDAVPTYSLNCNSKNSQLKVFNVGSYQVSVAMNLNQIQNVDKNIFNLSSGLNQMLNKYYNKSFFGFIICKLNSGKEKYHPLAYSHKIINSKIFIPTKHYHQEIKNIQTLNNPYFNQNNYLLNNQSYSFINNQNSSIDNLSNNSLSNNKSSNNEYADDWSHSIYLYNINLNNDDKIKKINSNNKLWNEKIFNRNKINFDFGKCNNFEIIKINGNHPNIDLIIPILV